MVRVSSSEINDDQNLFKRDFKCLDQNEDIPCETRLNQNIRNQQKYK